LTDTKKRFWGESDQWLWKLEMTPCRFVIFPVTFYEDDI
jgi:hypothetical protein